MASKKLELASIVLGTLFSVIGLAFGTYDPLWKQLSVNEDVRSGLTTAASLFFLLMGFLIAIYVKAQAQEDSFEKSLSELKFQIPQLSAFKVFDANAALAYLTCQLPLMNNMLNTRIASNGNANYITSEGRLYSEAMTKAIKGGLYLREIVNKPWEQSAIDRKNSIDRAKGAYEYQLLDTTLPSFLNFCVLAYPDGKKEVLFGWAITKGRRFEQKCFLSHEPSVVAFFEAWFNDLYSAS